MHRYALLLLALVSQAVASPDFASIPLSLPLPTATIGGTLLLPRANRPVPCVVLVGGTLSQLRDGELDRPGIPRRTALKRLAESLAAAGYASFRYDQPGHGASRAKESFTDLYEADAVVLAAARAGNDSFEVVDGAYRQTVNLARRREELRNPPDEMFAYINGPALALAGTRDLNVAPHHAACAVAV
ncbi:MAG: hypothetical protein NTY38_33335, partial [Acidobacteria bacterium]|nr:hypothetical protein [Acidobacteriota bacterium]